MSHTLRSELSGRIKHMDGMGSQNSSQTLDKILNVESVLNLRIIYSSSYMRVMVT